MIWPDVMRGHQTQSEELQAKLTASEGRAAELLAALNVIASASERSETMFGGKMSEVTRVFEHITRVSRAAIAKADGQGS